MTAYELFDNARNLLTEEAIRFIELTDSEGNKDLGNFKDAESFNRFVAEIDAECEV